MKKIKLDTFLPDYFCFVLLVALIFVPVAKAAPKEDFLRYEKIFNSLEMTSREGQSFKLKDLKSPIVVVNFWASWCIPCLEEMPAIVALTDKAKNDKLLVVSVNTEQEDQLKNIAKMEKRFKFNDSFIIVPDKKFRIADEYKFTNIPVTIVYRKGKVVDFFNGPLRVPPDLW